MQNKQNKFNRYYLMLPLCSMLFVTACSSGHSGHSDSATASSPSAVKSPTTIRNPDKDLIHTHASNECTAAVAHSHAYTDKNHEHSYDCESSNAFVGNAHVHPATDTTRIYRHVHPNGAREHSHERK